MRIAIFTDTFLPQVNGVVRSIVTTANALARRGHQVAIFTINVEKLDKSARAKELDVRVKVYPFSSFMLPTYKDIQVRIPTFVPALYQVSKFGPDLIHSHTTFGMGWEAVMASSALDVPLVGTHHGFLAEYLKHVKLDYDAMKTLTRRYMAFYYNRCDAVIAPSSALTKELREYKLKRAAYVISNPMDFTYFSTEKSRTELKKQFGYTVPVVMHFGRLSYEKSVDQVLEAFAIAQRNGMGALLLIVGDGPEREKLEALSRKLRIADQTVFTGVLRGNDLIEQVASGDIFVSASTTETQGLVFLEAMALGLAPIGVKAGGIPEYVKNEENGLLVSPGNIMDLSHAMTTLIQDPALRSRFSQKAQKDVQRFDADLVIKRIEDVYQTVVRSS